MDKEDGLTNYFMGTIPYKKVVRNTIIDNLYIITSGVLPPNPSELLASTKMQELLDQLQSDFDVILVDSPPIIAVTDAAILSTKVDGTILVVSSGKTNRDAIQRARDLLEDVNSRVLGVLLNGIDLQGMYGSYYYYYYYHYYYNYYSKPGKKRRRSRKY
jgi:tyrosine-protein kinase Etk/Wzc